MFSVWSRSSRLGTVGECMFMRERMNDDRQDLMLMVWVLEKDCG